MRGERRGTSDVAFFIVAALVFYALSLGRYFEPAYRVVFALPFGDLIRCPVKWHHLTEFCLVVLAAYGVEAVAGWAGRIGRFAPVAVGALVVVGTVSLACNDRLYCAPVSVREARRTGSTMQLSVLPRQQFQNPQVAAMAKAGRIVSVANYLGNPDYFLVGVLEKPGPRKDGEVATLTMILGLLSVVATLGTLAYGIFDATHGGAGAKRMRA